MYGWRYNPRLSEDEVAGGERRACGDSEEGRADVERLGNRGTNGTFT